MAQSQNNEMAKDREINGLRFIVTSHFFPEQYSVIDKTNRVLGYASVRCGTIYCRVPEVDGELVYMERIGGYAGKFSTDEERNVHLVAIAEAIITHVNQHRSPNTTRPGAKYA